MIRTNSRKDQPVTKNQSTNISDRKRLSPPSAFIHVFPSDMGWMGARWNGQQLAQFVFGYSTPQSALNKLNQIEMEPEAARGQAAFEHRLQAFARGTQDDFRDIPLDLDHLTVFQRNVIGLCRRIGFGRTLSYGELARRAGRPGAARAVGNTMACNRFPLIVPCHRVVGANGLLGGYSGTRGIEMKRELLGREGWQY